MESKIQVSKIQVSKIQVSKIQVSKIQVSKIQVSKIQGKLFLLLEVTLLLSLQVAANSRRPQSLLLFQPALRVS
jgi:hypothetical protein